ncbi:MAG: D-alanine--D-alanine ligase [Phycisphaeraceae bacterium]|nr:D-alanine--D-alanine ligase [Phycisphaeraceae bacterium]
MLIGLTYDLRRDYLAEGYGEEETAEFDRPDTIDAIEAALQQLGHQTQRIGHMRHLMKALLDGRRWDMVFNIAEGLYGFGREAAIPAILDQYRIPYTFSDALVLSMTLHKGVCKRVARDAGVPTPAFTVVQSARDIAAVNLPLPLFVKPVAEGTGKGVTPKSIVRSWADLDTQCRLLLERYRQPVLVETLLPGREFTTGIVGTGDKARALGTMEIILLKNAEAEVYSYVNKEECETLVEYRLADAKADPVVKEAEEVAVQSWRALDCRDAGRVDLRCDPHGRPQFIEVNPLAGINPVHSDLPILCDKLGLPYLELIRQIVDSALERVHS